MTIMRGGRHMTIPALVQIQARAPHSAAAAAGNWWEVSGKTCVAAYQPKGAASYAASKVNLANPGTYNAADGAAYPTWDTSTGWTFNGSTQYVECGVTPTADWTIIVRFANAGAAQSPPLGLCGALANDDVHGYLWLAPHFGNNQRGYIHACARTSGAAEMLVVNDGILNAGVMAIAGNTGYADGTSDGTFTQSTATIPAGVAIGAIKSANYGVIWHMQVDVLAAVVYSDTLTSGEVATVSAAMAAL